MTEILDAFWRAVAYCVHPRVVLWSLLPVAVAGSAVFAAGWFFWEDAVAGVRAALEAWNLVAAVLSWLDAIGAGAFRSVIAPLVVVALAVPMIVVLTLLLVAWLMASALAELVVQRRFPDLKRQGGAAAWWHGFVWSLGCAALALLALVATMPLWLVPPLALVLPALIWGWLAARILAFDALALHASADERHRLMHAARWPLLGMGFVVGLLGSVPSLIWALAGVASLILAPLVMVAAVWLYTLAFAFSSLWFAHFMLARLQALRVRALSSDPDAAVAAPVPHDPTTPP